MLEISLNGWLGYERGNKPLLSKGNNGGKEKRLTASAITILSDNLSIRYKVPRYACTDVLVRSTRYAPAFLTDVIASMTVHR